MTKPIQMPRVTRVEVIDSTGRAFVAYYEPGIEVHTQDDGRTVKIFAGERSDGLGREREAELEEAFQSRDWATVEHLLANPDAPPVGHREGRRP